MRALALSLLPVLTACALIGASAPAQTGEPPAAPEAAPDAPEGPGAAIVVIDGSGSMWGRIEERPKIEIARDAVTDLLEGWSSAVEIGLMAYGHRSEGDCSDIELIADIGPPDREALRSALGDLTPRGKTPMSDAIARGAERLSFEDRPATVILVSDGRETCAADPCAVARELEQRGLAFTAHVVGFDVAEEETIAQLQCIADNTGGRYVGAGSAEELSGALEQARGAAAAPTVTLAALEGEDGPVIPGIEWRIEDTGEPDMETLPEPDGARPTLTLAPGDFTVTAMGGDEARSREITLEAGESAVVNIVFEVPDASLSAPDTVQTGGFLDIEYSGPSRVDDYITYVAPDAEEGAYLTYEYVEGEAGEMRIRASDETGAYELRYVSAAGRTLARTEFEVTESTARLSLPDTVRAGAPFTVEWTGPGREGDYLSILRPDEEEGSYGRYVYVEDSGGAAEMRAPTETGTWQVRYLSGGANATFARENFEVIEATATIDAPDSVMAGSSVPIEWTGPGNQDDYVTIVSPDAEEGSYGNYEYVAEGESSGMVTMRAPEAPGAWQVRYLSGLDNATFARDTFEVSPTNASVTVSDSAPPGSEIEIEWTGPANEGDYLTIVPAGTPEGEYRDWVYVEPGEATSTLAAPEAPGEYEVRYLTGGSGSTLARAEIEVTGSGGE